MGRTSRLVFDGELPQEAAVERANLRRRRHCGLFAAACKVSDVFVAVGSPEIGDGAPRRCCGEKFGGAQGPRVKAPLRCSVRDALTCNVGPFANTETDNMERLCESIGAAEKRTASQAPRAPAAG